jgi:hypothetical protein
MRELTEKELKELEERFDSYHLEKQDLIINGKIISKMGELKKYATSLKFLKEIEDDMSDNDFDYIYKWLVLKLRRENKPLK